MTRTGMWVTFLSLVVVSGATLQAQRIDLAFMPKADLSVTVTDTPGSVTVGGYVTFTVEAVNLGPQTAMNVQLWFSMPGSSVEIHTFNVVSMAGASGSISCTWGGGCYIERLASGGRVSLRWHVMTEQVGAFYSTASVSADTPDPVSTNNRVTEKTGVNARSADLWLEMSDAPPAAIVNHPVIYTVDVVNQGPDATDGVRVTVDPRLRASVSYELESLSSSATYVDCHGYVAACQINDFASGARARIRVAVSSHELGSQWVTARVSAIEQDPNVNNNDAHELTEIDAGHRPIADAGDAVVVSVTDVAQLDGGESSDADSDDLTYRWSFVSRPAGSGAVLNSGGMPRTPTFVVDRRGTFVVQLVVNDGFQDSQPDTVTITAANSPPIAHAGRDQTVPVAATVVLTASGSWDYDGDALGYWWTVRSAPAGSSAVLSDPFSVNPTFAPDLPGTYTFDVIAHDGIAAGKSDAVVISTVNSRPVANAGPDQKVRWNQWVSLDGSDSWDVDGDRLRFSWGFISRPAGSAAVLDDPASSYPHFTVDVSGTYVLSLTVSDPSAGSLQDRVTITTDNVAPIAHAGLDQSAVLGDVVTLDGSGSRDGNNDPLRYFWSLTTRPVGSAAALSVSAETAAFLVDLPGTYVAQLIVHDGKTPSVADTVTIATGNVAPIAEAGSVIGGYTGRAVLLDGSRSHDANGDSLSFRWSLIARPNERGIWTPRLANPTSIGPSFVPEEPGHYIVQLIVSDGVVDSAPATVLIRVYY